MKKDLDRKSEFRMDWAKWLVVFLLLALGIYANLYYSNQPLTVHLVGWILLLAPIFALAYHTNLGRQMWEFLLEARGELRKVVWPTRPETVQTTLIVLAMVIVVSLILWGIDSILLWAVAIVTGHSG